MTKANGLSDLKAGISIPEFGIVVPWGATESELFALVPEGAFARSLAGWPLLRFTFLGIEGVYAFNFVTHPQGRLVETALASGDPLPPGDERPLYKEFARVSRLLRGTLGKANWIDSPKSHHRRWGGWDLWVDLSVAHGVYSRLGGEFYALDLSIYAKFVLKDGRP